MEQFILYHDVRKILLQNELRLYRSYVGNYFTSLEMAGVTLTIMKVDEELKGCIDYECDSMGLRQFRR
jgi:dihydroxyacetone kinase-like protein